MTSFFLQQLPARASLVVQVLTFVTAIIFGYVLMHTYTLVFNQSSGVAVAMVSAPAPEIYYCPEDAMVVQVGEISGHYYGRWDGGPPSSLSITTVEGSEVRGYYAWGMDPDTGHDIGGCAAFEGVLDNFVLSFDLPHAAVQIEYIFTNHPVRGVVLEGEYSYLQNTFTGVFEKMSGY